MSDRTFISIFLAATGLCFIWWGLNAVNRKEITLGTELDSFMLTFRGRPAAAIGWCFVLVGVGEELLASLLMISMISCPR